MYLTARMERYPCIKQLTTFERETPMSILPMSTPSVIALKPIVFLMLRSAHRSAIRFGRSCCNLLADAALERGRAVTCAYLTAMGIDANFPSRGECRRGEREY
jgi:hypothetical protein